MLLTFLVSTKVERYITCATDVKFVDSPSKHLRILFKGGKNDLYTEGAERIVAANPDEPFCCPVRFTENYFRFLGGSYDGYLVPVGRPDYTPDPTKPLHYSLALEDLRRLLTDLGYDGKLFGEHSGKRGGASAAVGNGMDMETLQRLGRWRSTTVPAKYVDLDTNSRIEMSKKLQKKF